jgi:hypothetical protein
MSVNALVLLVLVVVLCHLTYSTDESRARRFYGK